MRYDTILFDLDGTLLDTLDDLRDAVNHGLAAHGLPPASTEEIRARVGNGSERLISLCLPGGREDPRFRGVFDSYYARYLAHGRDKTRPYPGIPALLQGLGAAGAACAVVSNKPHEATVALAAHYFPGLLRAAVGQRAGVRRKPAPDMVLGALAELGADPARSVYVGDSEVDIRTAENAGLPCVSVSYGFRSREALLAAGASCLADDAAELARLLLG